MATITAALFRRAFGRRGFYIFIKIIMLLGTIIGHIPSRPFELKDRGMENFLDFPIAFGAMSQWFVREFLYHLESLTTLKALILIQRHFLHLPFCHGKIYIIPQYFPLSRGKIVDGGV